MPNDKLPNPIPAGTVAFVPDTKGVSNDLAWVYGKRYTRHTLTAPLHHLTPEMELIVRMSITSLRENGCPNRANMLEMAFAHVLTPQETVKEVPKTLVERAMALRSPDGSLNPTVQWNDSVLLDALSVIDALRAAFALLLERKAEESKEKTVRERLKDYCADPSATDLLFAASLDSILARLDKAGI